MSNKHTYIAFLLGINVGGYHKVPMADLRAELGSLGMENVVTLLNTGNVIFDAEEKNLPDLQQQIAVHLQEAFGFSIPTILKTASMIRNLIEMDPFQEIDISPTIRRYVSFLWAEPSEKMSLPWRTEDGSYQILDIVENTIISVLVLAITGTPKGMESLEKRFGKEMTTRNWNTILRVGKKLEGRT